MELFEGEEEKALNSKKQTLFHFKQTEGNELIISIESDSKSGEEVLSICSNRNNSNNNNINNNKGKRRCVFKLKQQHEQMLFTVINFMKYDKTKVGEGDGSRFYSF